MGETIYQERTLKICYFSEEKKIILGILKKRQN